MYDTIATTTNGLMTIDLGASLNSAVDEHQNFSSTDSPTPPWQSTLCIGLNATVDGSCLLDVSYNTSTSTVTAAWQCAVLVKPWALFLLAFPLMTVFGNVLVCLSVYRERNLRTATNFFIVSLAVADIMVAILVMPLAVYVEVGVNIHFAATNPGK